MGTYIPHREGVIQTIIRDSLTQFQACANPGQSILDRLEQCTGCADWSKGVARIRCEDCGHSYFRPFSCKVFHLCPSCDQKRTLLYAEYLAEDLLLDLPHRQFVFTIPKILRPYFKSDKRLFGEVSKLIFSLLSEFFSLAARQELLCACVVSYQPLKARVKHSRALSLWTNWLPICRREECNWFGDMGCTPGKFASSGNSVRVFTA